MKKVLITGGNGFIGRHLRRHLEMCGYEIFSPTSAELNILRQEDWEDWKTQNIEYVIHLAGRTFVPDSWENPEDFFKINTEGTLNVIRFCRAQNIGMTYISAYIYGQPKRNPIPETAEVIPNNPYARSKYMAEELCKFFCEYYDMDITVLRLFNVFGPGQKEHFLIPFIIKQILNKDDVISVQDLMPRRDYIYIEDVCRAIKMSIHKSRGYQLYNVGSGQSFSVGELIELSQKIAGTNKEVVSKNVVRKNELNDVIADIRHIECEWGWKPEVSLKDGLAKCMEVNND
ncbi:NAD(P)-dependent oxidoreductase [bacterium 0.1xD8-71]|nr:NAD(P)-dependent oxidoreductase [bacterium 0.1xD8-71]